MFRTTRTNEKAHGDFEFHKYGNPSFERSVPKPEIKPPPERIEVESDAHIWSVPFANVKAACYAAAANDDAKLVALGGHIVKAL